MPHQIHCSLGYHFLNALDLPVFAGGVKKGVFSNTKHFDPAKEPSIPVTESELDVLIAAEQQAYIAYKSGGVAQKAPYIIARKLLVSKIDLIAGYVDIVADGDAKIISIAGFEATSFGDFAKPGKPVVPKEILITQGKLSGVLHAECESFGPNHQYGCIVTEGQPLSSNVKIDDNGQLQLPPNQSYYLWNDLNHNRKKTFSGLKEGVNYYFYYYVVNNLGVSPLSTSHTRISG